MKLSTLFRWFVVLFFILPNLVEAQLDTIHWIPPLHSRSISSGDIADHYVYLSTPETNPFTVTITDGGGNILATPTVSNAAPAVYTVGTGQVPATKIMVPIDSLNMPLDSSGLILTATEPFYANFRVRAGAQAGSLTAKGRSALGQTFRVGHWELKFEQARRNFVASVMATQNNTTINISDYDTNVVFMGVPNDSSNTLSFTLDAGESYVVSGYASDTNNWAGFIGALIQSNKPIVVNNGSMCGSIATTGGHDIGIDQIVPVSTLGKEYIVIEGNGNPIHEIPFVVAHFDSTKIFLNGSAVPIATVNAGEYFEIPNVNYIGTGHQNMYIRTSEVAYVFQSLGATTANDNNPGMNFIPPFSCFLPDSVDNISSIETIGSTTYSGDIIAFTEQGATLTVNSIVQGGAEPVTGAPWETYKISGFTGNVNVKSTEALAVGLLGFNGDAGFAGYFSGFSTVPFVNVTQGTCAPNFVINIGDTYDSYQWLYNDTTVLTGETDDSLFAVSEGYYSVIVTKGSCSDTSNSVLIPACDDTLGVSKDVVSITETFSGSNIFDVVYKVTVENFSTGYSYNVQVTDDITAGLPTGATASVSSAPVLLGNTALDLTNGAFNGDTDQKLLPGNDTLLSYEVDTIQYTIRLDFTDSTIVSPDYWNQVIGTSTEWDNPNTNDGVTGPFSFVDTSDAGPQPDSTGNNFPGDLGENDTTFITLPLAPIIGVSKDVIDVTMKSQNVWDITYNVTVENFGDLGAANVQVLDDIDAGLPTNGLANVTTGPSLLLNYITGGTNGLFNGSSDQKLLPGTGVLGFGAADTIQYVIEVDLSNPLVTSYTYGNSALGNSMADGLGPNDGITGPFSSADTSASGPDPDPNNNGNPNENNEADTTFFMLVNMDADPDSSFLNQGDSIVVNVFVNDTAFGSDIDTSSLEIITNPTGGTATVDTINGTIKYVPDSGFCGFDSLTYTICDTTTFPAYDFYCDTTTIVFYVNCKPLAEDDSVLVQQTDTIIIDVTNNDFDDGSVDSLSVTITCGPNNGNAYVNSNGDIVYDPDSSFCGIDTICYSVCDTGGLCDTALVFINVIPTDSDGDLIPDFVEQSYPQQDIDGDGIPNHLDVDSDNDGFSDLMEVAPINSCDPSSIINTDGDSLPDFLDIDSDNDGLPDWTESGSGVPPTGNDNDGDGIDDAYDPDQTGGTDFDNDGMDDNINSFTDSSDKDGIPDHRDPDSDNDGLPDWMETGSGTPPTGNDSDNDGIDDAYDVDQTGGNDTNGDGMDDDINQLVDTDGDGIEDQRDVDSDNDGLPDWLEAGTGTPPTGNDTDGDGIDDAYDVDQTGGNDTNGDGMDDDINTPIDTDGDGVSDFRDIDSDNDGIPDYIETDTGVVPTGKDTDGDGIDDAYDVDQTGGTDNDGDGMDDDINNPVDTDGDGINDHHDVDSDNDGIPDWMEADANGTPPTGNDTDGDGIDDAYDPDQGGTGLWTNPVDTDNDGVDDFRDIDSDGDGIPDIIEDGGVDIDGDGMIDDFIDNDGDGWDDTKGTNGDVDTDGDGIPDYRDLDSDGDGIPDEEENDPNGDGQGPDDQDGDGIPNYLDLDSDGDGIPDADEYDSDGDGIGPDDCDEDGLPDWLDPDSCDDEALEIPEAFSPNNDGVNDMFVIKGLDAYPSNSITIFNRWGNIVYEQAPYDNTWNGTPKAALSVGSGQLPVGTYFYILDLGDGSEPIDGYIYLNR